MGELNINNLTGAARAFADAADQNNDGRIEGTFEKKLFNQFITGAKLTGDEGIVLERQSAAQTPDEPVDPKKAQKQEKKMYENYFGKNNIDAVKNKEAECNRRVINAFKQLVATGQMSPDELNAAIASRPDMADYNGDAESYKTALENWADDVETAMQTNLKSEIRGGTEAVINNDNKNTTLLAGVTVATGEAVMENDNFNAAVLQKEIQDGTAQIIKQVKLEGGATRVAIRNAKGEIINAVKTAEGHIMSEVQWQSWYSRNITIDQGERTRDTVRDEGEATRDKVQQEADRIIDTLDPIGAKRAIKSVRDAAARAGKELGDFIKENPEFLIPGLGIPIYAARKLFQ